MPKKRPPTAHGISEDASGEVEGVLVCRAEGSQAQEMAIRVLEVDHGWTHDEAVSRILSAKVKPGRWYKTPDRNDQYAWIMRPVTDGKPHAGATPGVYYFWS